MSALGSISLAANAQKVGPGFLHNRERTGGPRGQPAWGGGSNRIQALNHVLQVLLPANRRLQVECKIRSLPLPVL
jgi:hypothetical protein